MKTEIGDGEGRRVKTKLGDGGGERAVETESPEGQSGTDEE